MQRAITVILMSVMLAFTIIGCQKPKCRLTIADIKLCDRLLDQSRIDPGTEGNILTAKQGYKFILIHVTLENLSAKKFSYDLQEGYLADGSGKKYETLGIVIDFDNPTIALGYFYEDHIQLKAFGNSSDISTTAFVFGIPESAGGLVLHFSSAEPIGVQLPKE